MAGDWIPWVKGLTRRPEVLRIAAATGLSRREVAATCMEIWEWFDSETIDGFAAGIDVPTLSRLIGDICPDFVPMMSRVGWLIVGTDGIRVPNFDRWMGRSAKARLKESAKKRRNRHILNQTGTKPGQNRDKCPDGIGTKPGITEQNRTEQSRGKNPSTTPSCSETEKTVSEQPDRLKPILTFPCDGPVDHWHLTGDHVAEWSRSFPSLDVLGECRRALAWIHANPSRRKTAKGMARYLVNWLGKAQDRGPARQQPESFDDRVNRITEGL